MQPLFEKIMNRLLTYIVLALSVPCMAQPAPPSIYSDDPQELFDEGDYGAARHAFLSAAASLDGNEQKALFGAANCLYASGDYADALKEYSEIVEEALSPYDRAMLAYRSGVCAFEGGDYTAAKVYFEKTLGEDAVRSDARFYLGVIAFNSGNWTQAENSFKLVNTSVAPGNAVPRYLAQIDFAQGRWAKALTQARQLLRYPDGSDDPDMLRIAGESLCRLGKTEEGVALLRKYLTLVQSPALSALYYVGIADYDDGEYSDAVARLTPVANGNDAVLAQSAYLYIGQSLMREGDNSAALLAFDKATQLAADDAATEAAYYNYAVAKLAGATVPFKSSAETLEAFLKRYPSGTYSDRVAIALAEGYTADRDYASALKYIDRVASPSKKLERTKQRVLYSLAHQQLLAGNLSDAEAYAARAAELKADREIELETILLQGQILADKGQNTKALDYFRRYLDRAPASAANRGVAEYGLAYALYSCGKTAEAEKYFALLSKKLTDKQILSDVYSRLGDLRYAADDFSAAGERYQKAWQVWPQGADKALLNYARMLGYQRNYSSKLQALADFRSQYPASLLLSDAMFETAQAQISLGRNSDAVATYREIIERFSDSAPGRRAYLQLAMTLMDMERKDDAVDTYRRVIALYPSSEEAAQAASLLKNIYAEESRGDEYIAFMHSVDNAPEIDAADEEQLAYDAAIKAWRTSKDDAILESFIASYPESLHNPEILALMLVEARGRGDNDAVNELADRVLERYPSHTASLDALASKADLHYASGRLPEALDTYRALESRATDASHAAEAQLGVMRVARDMGDYDAVIEEAEKIIAAAGENLAEARFTKACALDAQENSSAAIEIWQDLAENPADIFGAKSAYHAAEALFESGKHEQARKTVEKFVKSGSPHKYWIARGFILLSDIYASEGKTFEAREYLQALRDNYPGKETDINLMIESRLNPAKEE